MKDMELIGASLFSSAGIAETLVHEKLVHFRVANELNKERADFYSYCYPETEMICGDITDDAVRGKIVQTAKKYNVNFVLATPPCQGMSEAGKREQFDERNQLIFYAVDAILRIDPDFAIIENVPQALTTQILVGGKVISIPDYLYEKLGANYSFNDAKLLHCKDHGVPQLRERCIFLLIKKRFGKAWNFPRPEPEITLREAIGDLPSLDPLLKEGLDETVRRFPDFLDKKEKAAAISPYHRPPVHSWKHVQWMMHTPSGKSAIYNEPDWIPRKDNGTPIKAHHNNYRRLKWDMPCRTITQNNGVISSLACVHPGRPYESEGQTLYSDPRCLSIYELMVVSTISPNWRIAPWAKESFIRHIIGEGIPSRILFVLISELYRVLKGD